MFRKEVEKSIAFIALLIFLVSLEGVIGFMAIEGWNFLDAFFMTIITLSTVGFHEVHSLTPAGKLFTTLLIITGIGAFGYAISRMTSLLVEADIRQSFRRRKMDKKLRALQNHIIVCGFGRNGQEAVKVIQGSHVPCAIIDNDSEVIAEHTRDDLLIVEGDAREEETLLKANLFEAKGLIATLPDDADNLYITLTAHRLNSKLLIVSRANADESRKNLQAAGANQVVLPDRIGGMRMAMEIIHPAVIEYTELLRSPRADVPRLGQVILLKGSPLIGQKTGDVDGATLLGCFLVGLQRGNEMNFPASKPDLTMQEGDQLVVFGLPGRIRALQEQ